MGETEIQIAIKMFEENHRLIDPLKSPYEYNMTCGLLAMARALAEMNDQIIALKMKVPIKQNAATGI
jgi:hypothetical protein